MKIPILEKTVFILKWGPVLCDKGKGEIKINLLAITKSDILHKLHNCLCIATQNTSWFIKQV